MGKKKKTKEQKIISDLRRKLSLKEDAPSKHVFSITQLAIKSEAKNTPRYSSSQPTVAYTQSDYTYLTGGLKKIALLTGLAILFQGVLYLALR